MFDQEFEEFKKLHPPFEPVLQALLDMSAPFPATYLHRFSDLVEADLQKLSDIWDQVELNRRRGLLEDLEELNDADTLVSFFALARFALEDPDPFVRSMAIRLLWEDDDRQLAPIFIEMLTSDPELEVRATSANALGSFIYEGELEEIPQPLLHQVEESLLEAALQEDHPLIRRRALESLGFSSRPEVPGLIEDAYRQATPEWLASALFAMGRSADRRWQSQVLDMLDHPQAQVRQEAARAAGELELHRARPRLLELIQDEEDSDVRLAVAWSLSQIGGEGVRDTLDEIMETTEDEEEAALLEEALENLTFNEEVALFDLMDVEEEDPDDLTPVDDDDRPQRNQASRNKGKGSTG